MSQDLRDAALTTSQPAPTLDGTAAAAGPTLVEGTAVALGTATAPPAARIDGLAACDRGSAAEDGVVVVMPAYREEANLAATVEDFLSFLHDAGYRHCVVVADDGSPDGTARVLDELVERHPGRVHAVHHEVNRGYGAAVRSGIAAALEHTDLRYVLLIDADGQFRADDLVRMLELRRTQRADAVVGYRKRRADAFGRKVGAAAWNLACHALLRTGRDVDRAYKLVDRRLLEGMTLVGEAAAISPELVANLGRGTDRRVVRCPVAHYPRRHGKPTGARLRVVGRSVVGLAQVYLRHVRARRRSPAVDGTVRARPGSHRGLTAVTAVAVVVAVVGYLHHRHAGTALAYPDGVAHLMIARRVIASPTAGLAQLGNVWLPLPHLLALPLAWNDTLYQSGLAGSIVSMVAFVVTARYLYLLASAMAGHPVAGVTAALLFVGNANAVYLQSTPMTETLLLACVAAAVYYLHEWCTTGRYPPLVSAALATCLATLTRYEGWALCLAALGVVSYRLLARGASGDARRGIGELRRRYQRFEAHMLAFGLIAGCGVVAWLLWNATIFGDPLGFLRGEYVGAALWTFGGSTTTGDWAASARTYLYAMVHNIGWVGLLCGGVGLVVYAARSRLRPDRVAPYCLLVFLPFYLYILHSGERRLYVPEIDGRSFYNVRFGVVMLLAVAVFSGYLVARAWELIPAGSGRSLATAAVVVAVVVGAAAAVPGTATEAEVRQFRSWSFERANARAADWLRAHYDGGTVLIQSFDNDSVIFDSRIPMRNVVYEGSHPIWDTALDDPAGAGIRWVHMRRRNPRADRVWRELSGSPRLTRDFVQVYEDTDRLIYRRRDLDDRP